MAKPWSAVSANPEFQALPPDQQEAARTQYFDQVVAPHVPKDQLDTVRSHFDADTAIKRSTMDVTLPDGTVVKGVPEGTTKAQLAAKLKANGHDVPDAWMAPKGEAHSSATSSRVGDAATSQPAGAHASDSLMGRIGHALRSALNPGPDLQDVGLPGHPLNQSEYDAQPWYKKIGSPKPGEDPRAFRAKVEGADMPFPDILPTAGGVRLAQGVAARGGGAAGLTRTLGQGIRDVAGIPLRLALRGGDQAVPAMRANIDTFKAAGTMPSVGQATQRPLARTAESAASKIVGGYGPMSQAAAKQSEDIGARVTQLADDLSKESDPFNAGLTIEKGLKGPGGFLDRFKVGQRHLYDKLDPFFRYSDGSSKAVKMPNTLQALKDLNPEIAGAPETSQFFKNKRLESMKGAIESDVSSKEAFAQRPNVQASNQMVKPAFRAADLQDMFEKAGGDNLPYEAVKKIRTLVGEELADASLASDIPRSKWKALYAALSTDLDNAAIATGKPEAIKAMKSANAFTKAGHNQVEDILDRISRKGASPEAIFEAVTNTSSMKAGATKIAGVMSSLRPAERDVVTSAFLRRMGSASAGQQNAAGDVFSTQTFLTNWAGMSPAAKDAMFSTGTSTKLRSSLDAIAKTAENIKAGSKVFANPSGTAPSEALIKTGIGLVNPVTTIPTLLGMGAARLTAKMMTNPDFVEWLAKATRLPPDAIPVRLPAMVNVLKAKMANQPDDVQQDTDGYLNALEPIAAGAGQR